MEEASVSVGRSEAIGFPSENSQTRLQEEWHEAWPLVIASACPQIEHGRKPGRLPGLHSVLPLLL